VNKQKLQEKYNDLVIEEEDLQEMVSRISSRLEEIEVEKAHTFNELQIHYGNAQPSYVEVLP
jgi:hypothetical protein